MAAFVLTSCDTPTSYQHKPPRDMLINGKPYKVTNVAFCEDSSSCNAWVVYPAEGTGGTVSLQNTVKEGKTDVNVSTIVIQ